MLAKDDHVSRYCRPGAVDFDGLPTAAAFALRPGEGYLSVNWLEYFGTGSVDEGVDRVRETFRRKGFDLRRRGRFAVIGVDAAVSAVTEVGGHIGRVKHLPLADDKSHAGLFGYPAGDLDVANAIQYLIQIEDVHPAVVEP